MGRWKRVSYDWWKVAKDNREPLLVFSTQTIPENLGQKRVPGPILLLRSPGGSGNENAQWFIASD